VQIAAASKRAEVMTREVEVQDAAALKAYEAATNGIRWCILQVSTAAARTRRREGAVKGTGRRVESSAGQHG
jgi:hypothetical protein